AGTVRRSGREAQRAMRSAGSTVEGKVAALRHGNGAHVDLNDAALGEKVETQLFRDSAIPKGSININVERGIVVLRGEVASDRVRRRLERQAKAIDGVWSVSNLLHLPGEAAPDALQRANA
ncbi:MAG: BON domain-containing protein, partial [Candidatus Limnocylindria bacterium]